MVGPCGCFGFLRCQESNHGAAWRRKALPLQRQKEPIIYNMLNALVMHIQASTARSHDVTHPTPYLSLCCVAVCGTSHLYQKSEQRMAVPAAPPRGTEIESMFLPGRESEWLVKDSQLSHSLPRSPSSEKVCVCSRRGNFTSEAS